MQYADVMRSDVAVENITFRRATTEELSVAAGFWLAMYVEIGMFAEADFQAGWRERFVRYFETRSKTGEAAYFVAVDGDRVVATAGAMLRDGYPSVIHGLRFGYILGVYVLPEYRSHGLAKRLTQEAVGYLRAAGARSIRLHASNAGRPIYEKLGFTPTNEMQL